MNINKISEIIEEAAPLDTERWRYKKGHGCS